MSTESASPNLQMDTAQESSEGLEQERMARYKLLATAFSYPDDSFFEALPHLAEHRETLVSEYDRLFRAGAVWLYVTEYVIDNEFERARLLSDINGFYTAFGIESNLERPDAINCELEFMQYLIFKRERIRQGLIEDKTGEKADVCLEAGRNFFVTHVAPGAQLMGNKILSKTDDSFYTEAARELLLWIETEIKHFDAENVADQPN